MEERIEMKKLKGNQTWLLESEKKYVTIIKEKDGFLFCKHSDKEEISVETTKNFFSETTKIYKRLNREAQREYNKGFESGTYWHKLSSCYQEENSRKSKSGSDSVKFEYSFYIWLYWNGYKDGIIWEKYKFKKFKK